jgi:phosphate acetyltransferase
MEMASRLVERPGFFRPVVASAGQPDPQIELIRRRYRLDSSHDEMRALSADEANGLIAAGQQGELVKRVLAAYRALEQSCDLVVCEGTDFAGALDFGLNADLANELGAPVLAVVRGAPAVADSSAAVRVAREALAQRGCQLLGMIVTRVAPELASELEQALASPDGGGPVYVLPENDELAHPSVGEVAAALGATLVAGSEDGLGREVRDVRVAAMGVEHFVEDLVEGTLVIVPGDRPDIVVASFASALSPGLPGVAGIVLTAGYPLSPAVRRLLDDAPFAVLESPERTYRVATAVHSVRPVIGPESERKIATALGVFESGVDSAELQARISVERPARVTPVMFEYELMERARAGRRHIVLPEGEDERVLRAADILLRRGVVDLTLLGDVDAVTARAAALGLDLYGPQASGSFLSQVAVVDPLGSPLRSDYAGRYHELRKHKGITEDFALDMVGDVSYFGTMMVQTGAADGMVSGAAHTTGDTIRPAFEIIKARKDVSVVSSVFFMCLADRVLVYGDCAVNPSPNPEQLADIAISSSETAAMFGVEPRVAMLSYSTGTSAKGADVDAVREATELARERSPELKIEGPSQYDAAVAPDVAELKMPGSEVAGRATVLIFPDLESGNVAYKAVQRSAGAVAIGPVLQGLNKPVNDLSRGCTVTDIVNTVAITAIQAQATTRPTP